MIHRDIIEQSIKYYGKEMQSIVCMEEMAELTQCISKELRGKGNKPHLTEEIADVLICVELLKLIYNISEEDVEKLVEYKQERILERMESD